MWISFALLLEADDNPGLTWVDLALGNQTSCGLMSSCEIWLNHLIDCSTVFCVVLCNNFSIFFFFFHLFLVVLVLSV